MSGDEIGFSDISDVHRNERRSKILTKLSRGFYEKADQYLAKRRAEYAKESSNPANPKAMMLQDEIKKVDKRLCQIYEMRERKIVLASLNGVRPDNMASRDRALYNELSEVLEHYRKGGETRAPKERARVHDAAPGEADPSSDAAKSPVECQTEFIETEVAEPRDSVTDSAVVQVLEDIPPFVDVDHTYDLKKDDIVTLPSKFADLLSSKGMVRIVEG